MSLTSPYAPNPFSRRAVTAFPRHRRPRRPLHHYVFGAWGLALVGLLVVGRIAGGPADFARTEAAPVFTPAASAFTQPAPAISVTRVIDGDTFVIAGGERVRISNIDTAEMPPRAACAAEEALALAGKARLAQLLPRGARVELVSIDRDRDVYGRLLREVRVDGRDVGRVLVAEGLAQTWRGHKARWC